MDFVSLVFAKYKYMAIIAILLAGFGYYIYLKSQITYLESENTKLQQQVKQCKDEKANDSNNVKYLEQVIKNLADQCTRLIEPPKEGELQKDEVWLHNKKSRK